MAKESIPGQFKTRPTPPLSHALAADVAAASLEDRPWGSSVQRLLLSLNPPIPFKIIRRLRHEMLAHWAKQFAASGQFQVAVDTLRMWLPRTAVSVDLFHQIRHANQALTEVRQQLFHQVHGRLGRSVDPAWAHRMLLLRAGDTLSEDARARLENVVSADDPTVKLKAAWEVKDQVRVLPRTCSLQDAELAKERLDELVQASEQPETTKLRRTICRRWKEIEVPIVTGATTGKVEANNTAIMQIRKTARG